MNKKEMISPILIIALSLLFAAICFAVFLSRGKSHKWIARKMKIGGILLSISAISVGNACTMCYDEPNPDYFKFNGVNSYWIEIDPDTENTLYGTVYKPDSKTFSFSITDSIGNEADKNMLIPLDGEFGSKEETFKLEIKSGLPAGLIGLNLYNCDTAAQLNNYPLQNFSLNIKP